MSKEFPDEKYITADQEGSDEGVRLKKEIQIDLIRRYYDNFNVDIEDFQVWIDKYSAKFQTVFDRMIKSDPHFWLHDQQTRDATLTLVEDELYAKKGEINAVLEEENFEKAA